MLLIGAAKMFDFSVQDQLMGFALNGTIPEFILAVLRCAFICPSLRQETLCFVLRGLRGMLISGVEIISLVACHHSVVCEDMV